MSSSKRIKNFELFYKYQLNQYKMKKYAGKSIGQAYPSILKDSKNHYSKPIVEDIIIYDKLFRKISKDKKLTPKNIDIKIHSSIHKIIIYGDPIQNIDNSPKSFEEKIIQVINFIKTSSKEDISKKLNDIIKYNEFCPTILGGGSFGEAYIPNLSKTLPYIFGKKKIDIPIVVKKSHRDENSKNKPLFGADIIESKLFIHGSYTMSTEAIILMYLRSLYKLTVHLPLILGYGTCSKSNLVNQIVTMKYGLEKEISVSTDSFENTDDNPDQKYSSTIATLSELFTYIYLSRNSDGSVILPNGIKCQSVAELFDYICISYLATHELLTKNRIYPSDMHVGNIFIHWLNDKSYYDKKNIKNVEEIVYKVGKKYYKIKTFGFVIILGDTGLFNIKVSEEVVIFGHTWDIFNSKKSIEEWMIPSSRVFDFLDNVGMLIREDYYNTIVDKIFKSDPYKSEPVNTYMLDFVDLKKDYLSRLKSPKELLEFYDEKYGINKYEENPNSILIKV